MTNPHFILLHVDSPTASAIFYAGLLGLQPIESAPTFALFALSPALMLGLWSRHTAEPKVAAGVGGSELALTVQGRTAVDAMCAAWCARGVQILQQPIDMDFGRNFVAVDPDGHRLRVFAPA